MRKPGLAAWCLLAVWSASLAWGQARSGPAGADPIAEEGRASGPGRAALPAGAPQMVVRDGRHALLVDGKPYLMLGAQVNNSSAWPAQLPKVWPVLERMGVNTVEMPVYWEQMEPREGSFDFSLVDTLVSQAREHEVHLVLLWFGTWKNNAPAYTPGWLKLNNQRYPRVVDKDHRTLDSMSPYGVETLRADKRAFAALMKHLRALDGDRHTVLMVQVENEAGLWNGTRDFGEAAERQFRAQVPAAIVTAMGRAAGADWQTTFGLDADEYFHAWSVARYIQQVAEAGKREYPLPMYCNAAIRDPLNPQRPPHMESGGPTDDVLPLWKAAAPALDALEPDIYMPEWAKYTRTLELFARPDNPLFVPESGNSATYAHYFFAVLGQGGFGFSPFGMDATGYVNYPLGAKVVDAALTDRFRLNYDIVRPMQRELAQLIFDGKVKGTAEPPEVHEQTLDFGGWQARVEYGLPSFGLGTRAPGNPDHDGEALVAQLGPDEFLVTAVRARVSFETAGAARAEGKRRLWVTVEQGSYRDGVWTGDFLWNGDQTDYGLNFTDTPQVLRVKLASY